MANFEIDVEKCLQINCEIMALILDREDKVRVLRYIYYILIASYK